jgi:hypothetical protein
MKMTIDEVSKLNKADVKSAPGSWQSDMKNRRYDKAACKIITLFKKQKNEILTGYTGPKSASVLLGAKSSVVGALSTFSAKDISKTLIECYKIEPELAGELYSSLWRLDTIDDKAMFLDRELMHAERSSDPATKRIASALIEAQTHKLNEEKDKEDLLKLMQQEYTPERIASDIIRDVVSEEDMNTAIYPWATRLNTLEMYDQFKASEVMMALKDIWDVLPSSETGKFYISIPEAILNVRKAKKENPQI